MLYGKKLSILTLSLILLSHAWAADKFNKTNSIPKNESHDKGVNKVALLSFPEFFCIFTENSAPFAYVQFALQMDGKIQYFKTKTNCDDFKGSGRQPIIFGELITLFGDDLPNSIRREDGSFYKIETGESIRMFFNTEVNHTGYENPAYWGENPHPERVMVECRLLKSTKERDLCLWDQAGLQKDSGICDEMSEWRRSRCHDWINNIKTGKIKQ